MKRKCDKLKMDERKPLFTGHAVRQWNPLSQEVTAKFNVGLDLYMANGNVQSHPS